MQNFASAESDGEGTPEKPGKQRGGTSIRETEVGVYDVIAKKPPEAPRGPDQSKAQPQGVQPRKEGQVEPPGMEYGEAIFLSFPDARFRP
jgi:hypothetical protein